MARTGSQSRLDDSLSREEKKTLSPGVFYRKVCGWAYVNVYADREFEPGWNELGTLPEGYRPDCSLYFPAQIASYEARGYISSEGRVAIYHFGSSKVNNGCQFVTSFPV